MNRELSSEESGQNWKRPEKSSSQETRDHAETIVKYETEKDSYAETMARLMIKAAEHPLDELGRREITDEQFKEQLFANLKRMVDAEFTAMTLERLKKRGDEALKRKTDE